MPVAAPDRQLLSGARANDALAAGIDGHDRLRTLSVYCAMPTMR